MLAMLDSISDMVRIASGAYLCVFDRKWDTEPGPRAAIIEGPFLKELKNLSPPRIAPVDIEKYPADREEPPNDLEAVTKIDGLDGHFLLVEAGYYKNKFGRAIHVQLERDSTRWRLSYVGAFKPRPEPVPERQDQPVTTKKWDEIEGAATIARNGTLMVVYATRGDIDHPAMLNWVPLVVSGQSYRACHEQAGRAKIADLGSSLGNRGAGSLLLIGEPPEIAEPNAWRVRTVATYDPGHDFGPFRSAIYDAGMLVWDGMSPPMYTPPAKIVIRWTLDGLKVEALAESPASIAEAKIAIATDDEELGGVWRPLPESKPTCVSAEMIRKGEFLATKLI